MVTAHLQKMQLEFKWLAEKSASLFVWRKRMAKDKDKKKKKNKDISKGDEFIKEYNESLELLKAKHEQLDGLIREAKLFLQEIKNLKEELSKNLDRNLDE